MDLFLSGRRVQVNDADLLGEGGEARVFRHGAWALKLFHAPTPQKVEKLRAFPAALPPEVVAPEELVTDQKGQVRGYRMRCVTGAEDFARLAQRKWRQGVVSNAALTGLFQALHRAVTGLHAARVVVGDLNDGNVLFAGGQPHLIDADSMQFRGLPCVVGHERFLDPRLYGVDLTRAPRFDEGSDWYAFAVLLFQSLLSVHPFGGTHPTLPTLLRRAEARHSVLRGDVTLPRLAVPPKVLPDDLLHWFGAVFEQAQRHPFPPSLLDLSWTQCTCGTEHARAVCPECRALGPLVTRPVLRSKGRCTARTAFETAGRVVAASLQGGLRYLCEEQGVLRREDGSVVGATGRHAVLQGPATWVADGTGGMEKWVAGRLVERAQTGVRGTTPMVAGGAAALYRVEQAWLVEQGSGARVGQVLEGQTWLWAGERLGLGFYRAGGVTVAFLLRVGKAGLKQLPGVAWRGRLVEADAVFDARHALLSVAVDLDGREVVQRWLFDEAGALLARSEGGSRGPAALLGGRVVIGTDAGLVALKADAGVLHEATLFPDSQPFVSAGDELLANADGSLFVVGARDITQLTLT